MSYINGPTKNPDRFLTAAKQLRSVFLGSPLIDICAKSECKTVTVPVVTQLKYRSISSKNKSKLCIKNTRPELCVAKKTTKKKLTQQACLTFPVYFP